MNAQNQPGTDDLIPESPRFTTRKNIFCLETANKTTIKKVLSFLNSSAAVWWFSRVSARNGLKGWSGLRTALLQEFVPANYNKGAHDRLRRLKHIRFISKYLGDFENRLIAIPGISDSEMDDRFIDGLEHEVRIEVLKSQFSSFDKCPRIALNVDNAR